MRFPKPIEAVLKLGLLLCCSSHLLAQEARVKTGDRVRVTAHGLERTAGTLRAVDQRFVTLSVSGSPSLQIPRNSVTKLEVSRGRRSNVATGLLLGTVLGFAGGAAFGAVAVSANENSDWGAGEGALAFGALGAGAGLVIGTIVGASTRSDRWEEVPLSWLRIAVAPASGRGGGVGVAMRLRT